MSSIELKDVVCTYPSVRILSKKRFKTRALEKLQSLVSRRSPNRQDVVALKGVSLQAKAGDILGIVGENGAGKTTLLRIVAGLLRPDSGQVRIQGSVSSVFGLGAGFIPSLTGRENIHLVASLYGLSAEKVDEIEPRIIEFAELEEAADRPVNTYSSGMRSRLGFSIVSNLDTDIIALDEVLSAGDHHFRQKAGNLIDRFAHENKILLVVSHTLEVVRSHCNVACFLHQGRVVAFGDPEQVCKAYVQSSQN